MENNFLKNFKSLNKNKKEKFVSQIFSNVADNYDLMNDLMSFGLHKSWKEKLVSLIDVEDQSYVLDLASGSGDLTVLLKNRVDCNCLIYDSNIKMLQKAKKKVKNAQIICGYAENLPFKKESFDYVMVAFGLRNFSDLDQSLREVWRVLKRNGIFLCLEFSEINNFFIRDLFNIYGKIIPRYAGFFLNQKMAYNYLIESIKQFPNQAELSGKLKRHRYSNIKVIDIIDGLASIHIAQKK